jgi:hypothetical protein
MVAGVIHISDQFKLDDDDTKGPSSEWQQKSEACNTAAAAADAKQRVEEESGAR